MGKKFCKYLLAFIDKIPDSKLEGGFPCITKICSDGDFRLDMQTKTTDAPRCYNLQVQVNKQVTFTSAKCTGQIGSSVAKCFKPADASWTPAAIRETPRQSAIKFGDQSGQF